MVHVINFRPGRQRSTLRIHDDFDITLFIPFIHSGDSEVHSRFTAHGLSHASLQATQGGGHGSESVGCASLDWPRSLGPSPHHRVDNAIRIPRAAPCLSFGRQSKGLGNVGSARHPFYRLSLQQPFQRPIQEGRTHESKGTLIEAIPPRLNDESRQFDHGRHPLQGISETSAHGSMRQY